MKAHWLDAVARKVEAELPRRNFFSLPQPQSVWALRDPSPPWPARRRARSATRTKTVAATPSAEGRRCRCKNGFDECGGKCLQLDFDSDDNNCGRCNNACDEGHSCLTGVCTTPDGCPAGADACGGERIACGDVTRCVCSRSTAGETICGDLETPGPVCGQCDTDADCASFGVGAFCVETGSVTCCGPNAQNVCRLPCPIDSSKAQGVRVKVLGLSRTTCRRSASRDGRRWGGRGGRSWDRAGA